MNMQNGTLTNTAEFGYVWTTKCLKCGTEQKIRIGSVSLKDADLAVSTINGTPRECPNGYHTELSGWAKYWSLDLMLAEYAKALKPAWKHELVTA